MAFSFQEFTKRLRQSFLTLAQAAFWIFGVIGGFLLPPPFGVESGQEKMWTKFAQFIICVLIGFVFVLAEKYRRKKDGLRWMILAISLLVLGTVSLFAYQKFRDDWTDTLKDTKVLVGIYLPPIQAWVKEEKPSATLQEVVERFGLKSEDQIWTKKSRDQRRLYLAGMYVASVPLFTVCLIAVLQGIYCISPTAPKRPRSLKKEPAP